MHVRSHLNDLPLPGVTNNIMFHVPAATYESSKDPGLGITNLSIWFEEASFSSTTFTMLRETLSILPSFTYSDKPCFEKHWHECSSTYFSLSFMVAFLNTLTFLSPSIHKKWRSPLRISCGFGHIHWRNSWWKICSACYAVNFPIGNHLQSISKTLSVIYKVLFQTLPDPQFWTVCWGPL